MCKKSITKTNSAKKGKKLPKWAIALIVIAVIIAIIGGTVLGFLWDVIWADPQNADLGAYYEPFGFAPITNAEDEGSVYTDYTDHFAQFKDEIELGMRDDATDEQKAKAAYIIYRVGCLANATAPERAKYSTGGGTATGSVILDGKEEQVGGEMKMTSTYYTMLSSNNRPSSITREGIDAFKANNQTYVASEEYTQIPEGGITASNESLVNLGDTIIRVILPFARRIIETPEGKITWNGNSQSALITKESATGSFADKKTNYDKKTAEEVVAESKYLRDFSDPNWYDPYGLTAPDLSIHVINPETIVGSSVKITKYPGSIVGSKKTMDYYSVDFKVDTEYNRGTDKSATYYAEQLYMMYVPELVFEYVDDYSYYYDKLEVNMTVFENGYFRTWGTNERWVMQGGFEKLGLSITMTADNYSTEAHCYDHDTVLQGFANRWIGDSEHVGKPRSELPFYEELKKYTPEEYGTYR